MKQASKPVTGIITVCSGKGGSGKTTTAAAVAGALKVMGADPTLLDLDYGASLTRSYGYDPASPIIEALLDGRLSFAEATHETKEGVGLIPASPSLADVDRSYMQTWRARLRALGAEHLLVIDTSDDILSAPVAAAILASDILMIPVPLSKKAYDRTYPEIAGLLEAQGHTPQHVWFGAMVDKRAALPNVMLKVIADDGVDLATLIPRAIAADEADFAQVSVVAAKPKSKLAAAYTELATAVYARLRKMHGAQPNEAALRPTKHLSAVNG